MSQILRIARYSIAGFAVASLSALALGQSPKAEIPAWKPLFDGKSLTGWKSSGFYGAGKVRVADGTIVLERGKGMTGITYTGKDFPRVNYEVSYEAKKLAGDDFFATATFPVGKDYCSFVLGGWGGTVVGLSSLNGQDASSNDTSRSIEFQRDKWYRIRIRVTAHRIESWIDSEQVVDCDIADRRISIRIECKASEPFGIATYETTGVVRNLRLRPLSDAERQAVERKKPLEKP